MMNVIKDAIADANADVRSVPRDLDILGNKPDDVTLVRSTKSFKRRGAVFAQPSCDGHGAAVTLKERELAGDFARGLLGFLY
jgi:hypothetical protein